MVIVNNITKFINKKYIYNFPIHSQESWHELPKSKTFPRTFSNHNPLSEDKKRF